MRTTARTKKSKMRQRSGKQTAGGVSDLVPSVITLNVNGL